MSTALWHDAQQGGYTLDLPIWRDLARDAAARYAAPVLELGAGTGRSAIDVARRTGVQVWALDRDEQLLDALRARSRNGAVLTVHADATRFALSRRFSLVYAPAAFVQIIGGSDARRAMLTRIAAHLYSDGRAALAVMDLRPIVPSDPYQVRRDGWAYTSAITDVDWLTDDRLRLTWSREMHRTWWRGQRQTCPSWTVEYEELTEATLEREARDAGLELVETRCVPPSEWAPQTIYVLRPDRDPTKVGVRSL